MSHQNLATLYISLCRCLFHYWQSLKQYTLLPDQSVQPLPRDSHILNFLDAEVKLDPS